MPPCDKGNYQVGKAVAENPRQHTQTIRTSYVTNKYKQKRSEVMKLKKRLAALAVSAVMVITMLPSAPAGPVGPVAPVGP